MRRSLAAAAVAAAFAAPAGAGTLTVGPTPGGFGFTYTAGVGETNNVQVSRVSATDVKITDTAGITLSGASGCSATNAQEVHCDPSLPIQSVDVITLGGQNDIVTFDAGGGVVAHGRSGGSGG